MKPQKQAFRHKPAEGIYGDCFRTAVACLLDLDRDVVPHDHAAEAAGYADDDKGEFGTQHQRMNAWLATRGLALVQLAYNADMITLDELLRQQAVSNPGLHVLVSGMSRTGCGHVVIACNGAIVWDPSLTDSGIVGPQEGLWWLAYIVVRA